MPRICITIPDGTPQPYRFPADTQLVTIGRAPDNDVVIDHNSISSHHCEMQHTGESFALVDIGSTNGILLDDERFEQIDLVNGLDLEVGDVLFNYQLSEEELATFAEQKAHQQAAPTIPEPVTAPAPPNPPLPTPTLSSGNKSAGRDFAIFLLFALFALGAFYFGLSEEHKKATQSESEPNGRVLWSDVMEHQKP